MALSLASPAFAHNGLIPSRHTCDGADLSPPLVFSGVPAGAASLVLVCDDPDAVSGVWDHFLIFDLSPATPGLPEGLPAMDAYPDGSASGKNSWGRTGYGGPCPPSGTHRYVFTLYALGRQAAAPSGSRQRGHPARGQGAHPGLGHAHWPLRAAVGSRRRRSRPRLPGRPAGRGSPARQQRNARPRRGCLLRHLSANQNVQAVYK